MVGKHRNSNFILLLSGDRCQAGADKGAIEMKLPTKKTTAAIDVARLRVTMHGPPKIGKTTTLSKIDDMLIIATEGGHDHIS